MFQILVLDRIGPVLCDNLLYSELF